MVPMPQWLKKAGEEEIRNRMPKWADSKALNQLLKFHFKGHFDNSHKIFALLMMGCYSDRIAF
jgi:hypothetical protein